MEIKFKLLPDRAPPRIDVPGQFHRDFGLEPAGEYVCTRDEWERYLYPTGDFEIVDKQKSVGVGDGAKAKDR